MHAHTKAQVVVVQSAKEEKKAKNSFATFSIF
jgi:hypothetical protein